jgi:hypothetical protein
VSSRGQTLTLFCLTLLLIVLMGLITLSVADKVHSRMELQTAADAAAWSNAVATARTLNAIAIMNRVQVAHTVSTLGTLSLISWSTLYWRHARNASNIWGKQAKILGPASAVFPGCSFSAAQTLAASLKMRDYAKKLEGRLRRDRELFENDTQVRWDAALELYRREREAVTTLEGALSSQSLALAVARDAQLRDVAPAPATGAGALDAAELDRALHFEEQRTGHAPLHAGTDALHAGQLVMGSRGHGFITHRESTEGWDASLTEQTWFAGFVRTQAAEGKAYLDRGWTETPSGAPFGAFAHDRGGKTSTLLGTDFADCPVAAAAFAVGLRGEGAEAYVGPERHVELDDGAVHAVRTFPPFVDYDSAAIASPDDVYAQPKSYAVLSRDLQRSPDPWELTFRFGPHGALDLRSNAVAPHQLALGTGIAYYSRFGHEDEPPNLFAPYWHAGLTRLSVDRPLGPGGARWDAEVGTMLSASGGPQVASAYRALRRAGYAGFAQ